MTQALGTPALPAIYYQNPQYEELQQIEPGAFVKKRVRKDIPSSSSIANRDWQ